LFYQGFLTTKFNFFRICKMIAATPGFFLI